MMIYWVAIVSTLALAIFFFIKFFFLKDRPLSVALFPLMYRVYISPIGYYMNLQGEKPASHSLVEVTDLSSFLIVPVAVRDDNYAYLIIDKKTKKAAAVDPADPNLVVKALQQYDAELVSILTTHKHWDHSGGNSRLKSMFPNIKIYGNKLDGVSSLTSSVSDGDKIKVAGMNFTVIECKVHTKGHVAYYLETDIPAIFSGDAIFVAGVGKYFESSGLDMYRLLERIKKLDKKTLLFPGHEYTLSNLAFAQYVEPDNENVRLKLEWTKKRRETKTCTVPSTLDGEFLYNPFFRTDQKSIQEKLPPSAEKSTELIQAHYLSELRKLKDNYPPKLQNPSK